MSPRELRQAKNQALFREVNERIAEVGEAWGGEDLVIICECAHTGCSARLSVALAEFERVREHPSWFLIAPGHALEAEHVIEEQSDYEVVATRAE